MDYFSEANDLYKLKEYRAAINLYTKSSDLKDFEAPSLYNSAVCFIKLKEYETAIPLLFKALSYRKDNKYFFNLAYCYIMLNDDKKALNYFNTAWSLENNDTECEKAINIILDKVKKGV